MSTNRGMNIVGIVILAIVVLIGGYVFYQETQEPDIEIELPDVEIN